MNLRFFSFLMLCASLLLVACEESTGPDDDDRKFSNIDVVTGLYLFDDNGNAVGRWSHWEEAHNALSASGYFRAWFRFVGGGV